MNPTANETFAGMDAAQWEFFVNAYDTHKANARKQGKRFTLTRAEWLWIWLTSGHAHERGTANDQYCMSRYGDLGGYEVGNVFIQTVLKNKQQGSWVPKKGCTGRTLGLKHGPRKPKSPPDNQPHAR